MLFSEGDLTPPVIKEPSVTKKRSELPTTAQPADTCRLSTFSILDAVGTQLGSGNLSLTRGGILRPINLLTKVAKRGQQDEQQDNAEYGKRVAVSLRTDSAVIGLVNKLALSPGAHNTYALDQ